MTALLSLAFGVGFGVGVCAVVVSAYRRRAPDPSRTPAAIMVEQVRAEAERAHPEQPAGRNRARPE